MITVTINSVDRTSVVKSLTISDAINNQVDTCEIQVEKTIADTYVPALNDEIIITRGTTRIFGGVITTMSDELVGDSTLRYRITAIDYTFFLNRKLVTERFENQTIADIIDSLLTTYAPDFTSVGVVADINVASIAFNRITVSECLKKLADLVNYNWYVDYYKDVHFFASTGETAPFTVDSGRYIRDSLSITKDITQLRNRVIVQGGDLPTGTRTVKYAGNGETATFTTHFKFATLPTVTVGGVSKTVGVEYLDEDTSFQCMWDFNQKYIRFTSGNIPPAPTSPAVTNIEITGNPLAPIIVNIPAAASIDEYGEYQFAITDEALKSEEQAIERALAELRAYSASLQEGSFDTYEAGLRSGQMVRIVDPLRSLDETFIIQKVRYRFLSTDSTYDGVWSVTVATTKLIGIVSVLQKLLLKESLTVDEQVVLLNLIEVSPDAMAVDDGGDVTVTTQTGPYTYGTAVCGFSTYG